MVFALYSVGETRAVLLHVGKVDRQRVPLWTQKLLRILEVKWFSVLSCTISGEGGRGVTRGWCGAATHDHTNGVFLTPRGRSGMISALALLAYLPPQRLQQAR